MHFRSYFLVGAIAYLIFIITSIPAALVISAFNEHLPVQINNVSGTFWNGQAGKIDSRKGIALAEVKWTVLPWRLLIGSFTIDVYAEHNNTPINSRVSANALGKYTVQNLELNFGASEIASIIALPFGELLGNFNIHVSHASWSKSTVPVINGVIKWNDAAIAVDETADLGDVSMILSEADDMPFAARISNSGGDLSLQGLLSTTEDGTYSLELTMKPTASASNGLVNAMSMFAIKQANGSYIFNNKGNLQQLGLM